MPAHTTPFIGSRGPRIGAAAPRKALHANTCMQLEHIPNIGRALADDLRSLGIHTPQDLIGQDGWVLYETLCLRCGKYHDPCVLDTFIAATRFMRGGPALPWWHHTAERKARYGVAIQVLRQQLPPQTREVPPR